jgi:hypothetical protein
MEYIQLAFITTARRKNVLMACQVRAAICRVPFRSPSVSIINGRIAIVWRRHAALKVGKNVPHQG